MTEDGRYLIVTVNEGTERNNGVFVQSLGKKRGGKGKTGKVIELLKDFDAEYSFVGNRGSLLFFRTDLDAPRGRLIAIDLKKPATDKWIELVPEHPKDTLVSVSHVGGKFFTRYLADAKTAVTLYEGPGKKAGPLTKVRDVEFPGIGSAYGFGGDDDDTEVFFGFQSFTQPAAIYRYELDSGNSEPWKAPKLNFNAEDFVTEQVFYTSKDGTKVPMFLVHHRDVQLDGNNPTYLYAYGGFNISLTPRFSVPDMVWMEMGGVYAQPSLRGGGEYGEQWHKAGTKLQKQNVFDDFAAAAEYLIAKKYTRPEKLAIGGRSNGGLLVGASITQRPELFGAALAGVGVMDMLRFHKFTIGWAWVSDYGSSENAEEFKALHAYSPLHNVKAGTEYPSTMVYTADHDDRVVPSHSFKFAAALQAAHGGDNPVLVRTDIKAGHGAGKPTSKRIEEWTDLWAFLVDTLDHELPPGLAPVSG